MKWLPAPIAVLLGLLLVGALTNDASWSYAAVGFGAGWVYCAFPTIWALLP